jgi:hypothetical protein
VVAKGRELLAEVAKAVGAAFQSKASKKTVRKAVEWR